MDPLFVIFSVLKKDVVQRQRPCGEKSGKSLLKVMCPGGVEKRYASEPPRAPLFAGKAKRFLFPSLDLNAKNAFDFIL